jgi:hypothetical protein
MLDLRKTLLDASNALKNAGISHALIGGFAMAIYGHHRATVDVDFLADGQSRDLIKIVLLKHGFQLTHESSEVLQFSGPGLLDILLANRPLSQEMLKHAVQNSSLGVYVVRAEDIIGLKIQAYKNDSSRELQDKADIQKLLAMPKIDLVIVKKYADLFDEWPVIEKLQRPKS